MNGAPSSGEIGYVSSPLTSKEGASRPFDVKNSLIVFVCVATSLESSTIRWADIVDC